MTKKKTGVKNSGGAWSETRQAVKFFFAFFFSLHAGLKNKAGESHGWKLAYAGFWLLAGGFVLLAVFTPLDEVAAIGIFLLFLCRDLISKRKMK